MNGSSQGVKIKTDIKAGVVKNKGEWLEGETGIGEKLVPNYLGPRQIDLEW